MRSQFFMIAAAGALAASVAGCQTTAGTSVASVQAPPETSASGWQMPWQLTQASSASAGQGERTTVASVSGYGNVRGTTEAIASLAAPLEPKPGRNRTVDACREVVEQTSAPLGAVKVEVVSGGPDRRIKGGVVEGPVDMRILYRSNNGYEVRQATLTCKVNARGKILDASA